MATPRCNGYGCPCPNHQAKVRQTPRLWTPGMDQVLTSAVERGEHVRAIAARLHLTDDSIKWRIKTLGLSLRDGWRSRQEVVTVLGTSRRAVDRWMREGKLRVTRHGTRWTRISDADLREFVDRYAGLGLDAEGISDPALRRLAETASTANRRRSA